MIAVALGIATAACWGLADFLGGLRAKRLSLAVVLLVSQLTAVAAIAAVAVAAGGSLPDAGELAPAFAAGACQLVAIGALYRALAVGTMSVVSPVSASGAAAIPVIVGLVTGERPGGVVYAGMVAAFVGVVLATRSSGGPPGAGTAALQLALVAAVGFGGFFIGMDAAVEDVDPFWALLAARACAGAVLVVAVAAIRPPLRGDRALVPSLVLIGLLDIGANTAFTLGVDTGLVSVVSVLAALYPIGTVLLARAVLRERLVAVQMAGVAVALAGVALIAAG